MNIALWVPCMQAKFLRGGLIPKPHIASTRKQRDAPVNSTGLGGLAISVLMVEQREAAGLFFARNQKTIEIQGTTGRRRFRCNSSKILKSRGRRFGGLVCFSLLPVGKRGRVHWIWNILPAVEFNAGLHGSHATVPQAACQSSARREDADGGAGGADQGEEERRWLPGFHLLGFLKGSASNIGISLPFSVALGRRCGFAT